MSEFINVQRNKRESSGREEIEVRSAQQARELSKNKALPLSNKERDNLKRLADKMEAEGTEY